MPIMSLRWIVSLGFVALVVGCSHEGKAPPPEVATTTTTSAKVPSSLDGGDATLPIESGGPQSALAAQVPRPTPLPADPRFLPETEKIKVDDLVAIDEWGNRYPDASKQLAKWMETHPAAASRLAAWDTHHPIRMNTIIEWAVMHRYEPIEAFFYGHSGWSELRGLVTDEHAAMSELVDWMRRSPHAAEELGAHPDGIGWAKTHLRVPTRPQP